MTDFDQTAGNEFIVSEASIIILPCGNKYVEIGEWTQCITENLLSDNIGSCLFGVFDIGEDLAKVFGQRHFNTAIVLGYVTDQQKSRYILRKIRKTILKMTQ